MFLGPCLYVEFHCARVLSSVYFYVSSGCLCDCTLGHKVNQRHGPASQCAVNHLCGRNCTVREKVRWRETMFWVLVFMLNIIALVSCPWFTFRLAAVACVTAR